MDDKKTSEILPSRGQVGTLKDGDDSETRFRAHGAARNPLGSPSTQRVRYRRSKPLVHSTRPSPILARKDKPRQTCSLHSPPPRPQNLVGTRSTSNAIPH